MCDGLAHQAGETFPGLVQRAKGVCFAIAGVNLPIDTHEALALLSSAGWPAESLQRTRVVDFSEAALIAGNWLQPGVVVVSNVGSAAYINLSEPPLVLNRGRKAGGWGPVIGDFGSAFDLGSRALRHVMLHHDARGTDRCRLCRIVLHTAKFHDVEHLLEWFNYLWSRPAITWGWRADIARVGFDVLDYLEKHEDSRDAIVTEDLIHHSTLNLAMSVEGLVRGIWQEGAEEELDVVLSGRVFERSEWFSQCFSAAITQRLKDIPLTVKMATYRELVGALVLAHWNGEMNPETLGFLGQIPTAFRELQGRTVKLLRPARAGKAVSVRGGVE
jgi:hypothetical protein